MPRKNGWSGSSSARDVAVVVVRAEDDPAGLERRSTYAAVDPVGAVVALDAALDAHDLRDQRAGRRSGSAPSWPTSEHSSSTMTQLAVGRRTPRARRRRCPPGRGRASRIACWKPPQVPRNGICALARGPDGGDRALRRSGTGCRGRPRCRRSPRGRSASVLGIQYGSSDDAVAAAQRVDQQRDAGVGADARRAVADEGELAVGMAGMLARALDSRPTIVRGRSIRDTDADGPPLPAHVRGRRPAAVVLRARRASSATRSRRSPSTSPRWRPTSARRC